MFSHVFPWLPRYVEDPLNDAHVPYNVPFQGHALGLMAVTWPRKSDGSPGAAMDGHSGKSKKNHRKTIGTWENHGKTIGGNKETTVN